MWTAVNCAVACANVLSVNLLLLTGFCLPGMQVIGRREVAAQTSDGRSRMHETP